VQEGGYLEPVNAAPPAPAQQAAPAGPASAPSYQAPAPPVVVTDLVPIQPTAPIDCASRGIGPCRGARP
jgi:hypothetical protein